LALECTDEPFENTAGTILWCFALRYGGEELWTLAPVRCMGQPMRYSEHDVSDRLWRTGKLCEGNRGEDERGGGKRGEIAREVCDAVK
jgi:hypothetical protein